MNEHANVFIIFSFVPTFLLASYIIHTLSQWRGQQNFWFQKLKPYLSAQVKTPRISGSVGTVSVMFVTTSTDKGPQTVIGWDKL